MRHREVDPARADTLGRRLRSAGEHDAGLRPASDLDLSPGEADARAERLPDCLLAREARRVVLRRVRPAVAVRALCFGEATFAEAGVALERTCDPGDLDQIDADSHQETASSQSGRAAIESITPSGLTVASSRA